MFKGQGESVVHISVDIHPPERLSVFGDGDQMGVPGDIITRLKIFADRLDATTDAEGDVDVKDKDNTKYFRDHGHASHKSNHRTRQQCSR